jgi:hypothetical protein
MKCWHGELVCFVWLNLSNDQMYASNRQKGPVYLLSIYCSFPLLIAFPVYHSPLGFLRHVDISLRFRRLAFKVPSPPKGEDEMQSVTSDKVVFGRGLVIGPIEASPN